MPYLASPPLMDSTARSIWRPYLHIRHKLMFFIQYIWCSLKPVLSPYNLFIIPMIPFPIFKRRRFPGGKYQRPPEAVRHHITDSGSFHFFPNSKIIEEGCSPDFIASCEKTADTDQIGIFSIRQHHSTFPFCTFIIRQCSKSWSERLIVIRLTLNSACKDASDGSRSSFSYILHFLFVSCNSCKSLQIQRSTFLFLHCFIPFPECSS